MNLRKFEQSLVGELRDAFPLVLMTGDSCIAGYDPTTISDTNFTELSEGRTWENVSYEECRKVDFSSWLSTNGIKAFLPAMLVASLYTEEADVLLDVLPRFLKSLVYTKKYKELTSSQLRCICVFFQIVSRACDDDDLQEYYQGFKDVYTQYWSDICREACD